MKLSSMIILTMSALLLGQTQEPDFSQFVGVWQGEGHFYNIKFSQKVGRLPLKIKVSENYAVTGKIGDAQLLNAQLIEDNWNNGFIIKAEIKGQIFSGNSFSKKCLVLMFKSPKETLIRGADFHLKSNYFFDFRMRQGGVDLIRIP